MKGKTTKLGDCYTVALHNTLDNGSLLCHGIVTGQGEIKGQRIGHAWNEMGDIVLDFSNGKKVITRKEKYYALGKITKVKRYTRKEVADLCIKHKHSGPWDSEVTTEWQDKRRKVIS